MSRGKSVDRSRSAAFGALAMTMPKGIARMRQIVDRMVVDVVYCGVVWCGVIWRSLVVSVGVGVGERRGIREVKGGYLLGKGGGNNPRAPGLGCVRLKRASFTTRWGGTGRVADGRAELWHVRERDWDQRVAEGAKTILNPHANWLDI
jgi:hypothetical protein